MSGDTRQGQDGANEPAAARPEANLRAELSVLKREVAGLRRLLETSRDLSSILDPDRLWEAILDAAIRLVGAQRGFLLTASESGFHVVLGRGSGQESLDREMSRVSETLARRCLEENQVIPYDNLSSLPEFRDVRSIKALSLYAAVCVPLRERGTPTGVLYLDSSSPGLRTSPQEIPLLEAFASHAAVSLLNARLMRRSEESRLLLTRENEDLRAEARSSSRLGQIVGGAGPMREVIDRIRLLKDTRIPVLLLGESGTGKDLVARALHYEGIHRDGPFVPVNCAGLPGDLLDSLMFGHRRGAFTGATHDTPGLVEQADGGTLFLDEIGDMPMPLQVKLLRFLEAGEFRRVGEVELRRAQTRVLSATNRNLGQLVREKSFREDLYFRLAGVCVEIPPLRERRQDIPLLVDFFFEQARERLPRRVAGISEGGRAFLMSHPWPGNVRQLQHTIEGACALVPEGSFLEESHLRMLFPQDASGEDASGRRRPPRTEREVLESILERHEWNVTRAAEELGFSRQHLHNRMRLHELRRPEP